MAKRKMGIMTVVLLCCLWLMPCVVMNASASSVKDPIITDRKCTLTISYQCDGAAFSDQTVYLYKIADVSRDFRYTLDSSVADSEVVLNKVQTNNEWNVIRTTLESYLFANHVEPILTAVTDELGQVHFSGLKPGMYFASPVYVVEDHGTYLFDSALIAVPGLASNGHWQYQVAVTAKTDVLPPIGPDGETQYKVLKLWRGDEGPANRPQSIEVEIFRDGVSYQMASLSEENHWYVSWMTKEDGAVWTVAERNVPEGYTVTVEKRGTTFVLINTWKSENVPAEKPDAEDSTPEKQDPEKATQPPSASESKTKTGDTANVLLYIVLMYLSGSSLVLLGIMGKSKRK